MISRDLARVQHDDNNSVCDNDICWDCLSRSPLLGVVRIGQRFSCGFECPWCRQDSHFDLGRQASAPIMHAVIRHLYTKSIKLDLLAEIVNGNVSLVEESDEERSDLHDLD